MKRDVNKLSPEDKVSTIKDIFDSYTGAPVVDARGVLVGVVSKKDLNKTGETVGDIMTKKVVAMRPTAKVIDAASLMLKYKVHRVPVVDNEKKVLGIVTRTDVFESLPESSDSEINI